MSLRGHVLGLVKCVQGAIRRGEKANGEPIGIAVGFCAIYENGPHVLLTVGQEGALIEIALDLDAASRLGALIVRRSVELGGRAVVESEAEHDDAD